MTKLNNKCELEFQADIVDLVNTAGGFAYKCNNRYMVGVADLFIKPPNLYPLYLEVKKNTKAYCQHPEKLFLLDVTVPQRNFLRKCVRGGMPAAVLSIVLATDTAFYRFFTQTELDNKYNTHRVDSEGAERLEYHVDCMQHVPFTDVADIYDGLINFHQDKLCKISIPC